MVKNIVDIMRSNKDYFIIVVLVILIISYYIEVNSNTNKDKEQINKERELNKDLRNQISELTKSINSNNNKNNRKKIQNKQNNYINRFYMDKELALERQQDKAASNVSWIKHMLEKEKAKGRMNNQTKGLNATVASKSSTTNNASKVPSQSQPNNNALNTLSTSKDTGGWDQKEAAAAAAKSVVPHLLVDRGGAVAENLKNHDVAMSEVPPRVSYNDTRESGVSPSSPLEQFTNFMPVTKGLNSPYPF